MDALSDSTKDDIRAHAKECYPNECCGVIIADGEGQAVRRCRNASTEPAHNARTNAEDVRKAEDEGEILASYHSHVASSPEPSPADKTDSEKNQLPVVILSWPADIWAVYQPCGWRAELLGRPFVHGVLDCYTLIQDYYRQELDIELPDFERPDDWWTPAYDSERKARGLPPLDLYLDNFEKVGFVPAHGAPRKHDVILMQVRSERPNHAAVYLGDGMMMHHLMGKLSCRHPYVTDRGAYALATRAVLRHRSLAGPDLPVKSPEGAMAGTAT
jgi:proteasome lid subunit RPN8/RPN11